MACKKSIALSLIFCLLLCVPVNAETTNDLYKSYNVKYCSSLSSNTSKILSDYYEAQKTAFSYNNILAMDNADKYSQVTRLKKQLAKIESQLRNGYSLPYSKLLSLEDEYKNILQRINVVESILEKNVEVESISMNLPTKSEYSNALSEFKTYMNTKDLGKIEDIECPIVDGELVFHSDEYTEFASATGSNVHSVFNATVSEVTDSSIVLQCTDYIMLKYTNIEPIVKVGDKLNQYDKIGTTLGSVKVGLSLNDTHVDLVKILGD